MGHSTLAMTADLRSPVPLAGQCRGAGGKRSAADARLDWRSSFRDWAGEETYTPHNICEAALVHIRKNKLPARRFFRESGQSDAGVRQVLGAANHARSKKTADSLSGRPARRPADACGPWGSTSCATKG